MVHNELLNLLKKLQIELDKNDLANINTMTQKELQDLIKNINEKLHKKELKESDTPELIKWFTNAIQEFEEEHPTITTMFGQIVTSLSNLGI